MKQEPKTESPRLKMIGRRAAKVQRNNSKSHSFVEDTTVTNSYFALNENQDRDISAKISKTKQMIREKTKDKDFKEMYQPILQNTPLLSKAINKSKKHRNHSAVIKNSHSSKKRYETTIDDYSTHKSKSVYGINLRD